MIVVLTEEAETDLEQIGDFIAQDSPLRTLSFLRELRDRCERLADFPRRFPLLPRFEHLGVRRFVDGDYLIFNRVGSETIAVLHVLHGALDYERLLFPNE